MSYQINGTTWLDNSRDSVLNSIYFNVYTLSTLPSGTRKGELAYVSDGPGPDGGLYYWNGSQWKFAGGYSGRPFGSGGVTYVSNGFKYHAFGQGTSTFSWTGGECEILLIGGGGGGGAGRTGGGGGAGGLSVISAYLPGSVHTVKVGAGSAGAPPYPGPMGNATTPNSNGGPTWIMQESGVFYVKGGGGAYPAKAGGSGAGGNTQQGSGGGGSSGPGYVNPGGSGAGGSFPSGGNLAYYIHGAGGGGSSGAGQSSPKSQTSAGRGGAGHPWASLSGLNPSGSPTAWYYSPTMSPFAPTLNNTYGVCGGGDGSYMPGYGNSAPAPNYRSGGGGRANANGYSNGAGGGGGTWGGNTNSKGGDGRPGLCIVRYPN